MQLQKVLLTAEFAVTAVLALLLTGCQGNKSFTPEHFRKVSPGMTEEQVQDRLGKPAETIEAVGVRRSFWKVGDSYYSISFVNGKVEEPLGPMSKGDYEAMKALMQAAASIPANEQPPAPKIDIPEGRLQRSELSPSSHSSRAR